MQVMKCVHITSYLLKLCLLHHSGVTHAAQYACTFPAMINDWREKWYQGTAGQTDPMFPFGFVQVQQCILTKLSSLDLLFVTS